MERIDLSYAYLDFYRTLSACECLVPDEGESIIQGILDCYEIKVTYNNNTRCVLEVFNNGLVIRTAVYLDTEDEFKKTIMNLLVRKGEIKDDNEFNRNLNLIRFRLTEPNTTYLMCGRLKVVTKSESNQLFLATDDGFFTKLEDSDFESWDDIDSVLDSINEIAKRIDDPIKKIEQIRSFTARNIIIPEKYKECITKPKSLESHENIPEKEMDNLDRLKSVVAKKEMKSDELVFVQEMLDSNKTVNEILNSEQDRKILKYWMMCSEFTLIECAQIFGISEEEAMKKYVEFYRRKNKKVGDN